MSKLVMIDSQVFIWGINGDANDSQTHEVVRAKTLLRHIEQQKLKLIIPTPQLAELLSGCTPEKKEILLSKISRFPIVPFDNIAALKFGELLHLTLKDTEIRDYFRNKNIYKARMKFDCMIVSIGIVLGVKCIYTHDLDLKMYAKGQVKIVDFSKLAVQLDAQLGNESIEIEDTGQ
jgi:hypothetical protein